MEKLRMGYVGCGFMAQKVHIPNILAIPECELLAIAEVRPLLGKRVQELFRIPQLYQDHTALAADSAIQAVAVSGHFAGQGEIAIDLLHAGKDVFVEKPMAVSVEQARRILEAERSSGRRLMVGYMKRYDQGNQFVKDLVVQYQRSGELGRLRYIRNHGFCGNWLSGQDETSFEQTNEPIPSPPVIIPTWMPEPFYKRYINYLQQYTHNINLVRWLLDAGEDVVVKSVALDEDGMTGIVVLEVAGVRTVIESGTLAYHGWDEHTQLYFERGWIRTEAPPLLLRNTTASVEVYRSDTNAARSEIFPAQRSTWSYKEEMRHFVTSLLNGTPFASSAEDTLSDVQIFEDIYRHYTAVNK